MSWPHHYSGLLHNRKQHLQIPRQLLAEFFLYHLQGFLLAELGDGLLKKIQEFHDDYFGVASNICLLFLPPQFLTGNKWEISLNWNRFLSNDHHIARSDLCPPQLQAHDVVISTLRQGLAFFVETLPFIGVRAGSVDHLPPAVEDE